MRESERLLDYRSLSLLAPLALTILFVFLLTACGGGLSRAEAEQIVRAEMAETPTPPQPEPGLTVEDVEEAVRKAMADMPEADSGRSKSEWERSSMPP